MAVSRKQIAASRRRVHASASLREALFGSKDPALISERILSAGVRGSAVGKLRATLGLSQEQTASVISVSSRTLARREGRGEPLDVAEADRLYRVARIIDLAAEMIGDRTKALNWMQRANVALGGETPLSLLRTEVGTAEVERVLYEVAYGGLA